jgi:hypothetical protein
VPVLVVSALFGVCSALAESSGIATFALLTCYDVLYHTPLIDRIAVALRAKHRVAENNEQSCIWYRQAFVQAVAFATVAGITQVRGRLPTQPSRTIGNGYN